MDELLSAIMQGNYTPQRGGYLSQIGQQLSDDQKKQQNAVLGLLADRFNPTMEDTSRSIRQTAQSYAVPNIYKPITAQDAADERVKDELAPYTTMLGLNTQLAKAQQMNQQGYSSMAGGGTGVLMNRLRAENPNLTDAQALAIINKSGIAPDASGTASLIPGYSQAKTQLAEAQQTGKNVSDLSYKPQIAGGEAKAKATVEMGTAGPIENAKTQGKKDAELQYGYSKAKSALDDFERSTSNLTDAISKAQTLAGSEFATGWGSYLSAFPNTDAGALQDYLQQIKANIGFDKLQEMRANSPTGGALGQVSDMENKLLQAVQGTLDPKQQTVLRQNLAIIKTLLPRVLEEKKAAFNRDYGRYAGIQLNGNAPPEFNMQQDGVNPAQALTGNPTQYGIPQTQSFDIESYLKEKGLK